MIEPKINWKKQDYFNVADYSRITQNLNELSIRWGVSVTEYPAVTYETYYLKPIFLSISNQYNSLITNMVDFDPIPTTNRKNWFSWLELNNIERLCSKEYVWEYVPLLDSYNQDIYDNPGDAVYCHNVEKGMAQYQSAYTGEEMDRFVDQIKEWNNGTI